jgi:hypothetical protein
VVYLHHTVLDNRCHDDLLERFIVPMKVMPS